MGEKQAGAGWITVDAQRIRVEVHIRPETYDRPQRVPGRRLFRGALPGACQFQRAAPGRRPPTDRCRLFATEYVSQFFEAPRRPAGIACGQQGYRHCDHDACGDHSDACQKSPAAKPDGADHRERHDAGRHPQQRPPALRYPQPRQLYPQHGDREDEHPGLSRSTRFKGHRNGGERRHHQERSEEDRITKRREVACEILARAYRVPAEVL